LKGIDCAGTFLGKSIGPNMDVISVTDGVGVAGAVAIKYFWVFCFSKYKPAGYAHCIGQHQINRIFQNLAGNT
jgi:hypothetical protein